MRLNVKGADGVQLFQIVQIKGDDSLYVVTGFKLERACHIRTEMPKVEYVMLTQFQRDEAQGGFLVGAPCVYEINQIISL